MKKVLKKALIILVIVVIIIVLVLVTYIIYLQTGYFRYKDNIPLEINNQQKAVMDKRRQFSAITYNVGFGAYDQDYSFFMDTGVMKTGEKVTGKYGKGISAENVQFNIENSAIESSNLESDFYLFQEVDIKASRSYNINQRDVIEKYIPNMTSIYASNFHSRFLFYPFADPHGSVEAGLLTLSKYETKEATRKSYTVDEGFFIKFFDLDRCFSVQRFDVLDGDEVLEFVLINHHMSAYDEGGLIRKKQMAELFEFADAEYQKGNYVVIGGDFNHALSDSEHYYPTEQEFPDWVSIFPEDDLPSGFRVITPQNMKNFVGTCRTADIPYEKGVNYEAVIDGFIVSSNVDADAEIIDLDYFYSDHNPVLLTFTLK